MYPEFETDLCQLPLALAVDSSSSSVVCNVDAAHTASCSGCSGLPHTLVVMTAAVTMQQSAVFLCAFDRQEDVSDFSDNGYYL